MHSRKRAPRCEAAVGGPECLGFRWQERHLRLTDAIGRLKVARESRCGYERDKFRLWVDADHDGCDTRKEVLLSEAVKKPRQGTGCKLTGGSWRSYYDDKTAHLGDRLFREPGFGRVHVVDFIDYGPFVGNVADIAIVCGCVALVLLCLRGVPLAKAPGVEPLPDVSTERPASTSPGD
ncbi:hypothetical protein [Streptomyces decoyicus]|uniref:hypothetical protein n=1 Tax=Streptomyces decoyicus TaxID=249567 RepID=UPI002DDA93B5|nr:hypothetical protein [Streptomyces decoyicus]